ncbi:MAG TPA: TfoX/Sxy family protein [Frankiaceae bacterium]|nr:TfoX/Sxy family protein [Frankiaceae bacterium]
MAYDEALADRVRELCPLGEKRMFGGLGFLTAGGHMAFAVVDADLLVRVSPAEYDEALGEPGARAFDDTGKRMSGWVRVAGDVLETDDVLGDWVERGTSYAESLPPK